jgi:hypothetical protein
MARKTKTTKQPEKKPVKAPAKKARKQPVRQAKKQPEKEVEKRDVVQTVNVVVGASGTTRRNVASRARRAPIQQVETISAKTLAPVFIQPPVASQTYQYPFDMAPRAGAVTTEPIMKAAEAPKTLLEDLRPQAEPLRQPTADVLADKEIVEPVSKSIEDRLTVAEKMIAGHKADVVRVMKKQAMFYEQAMANKQFMTPKKLPENPTTSVDSRQTVRESLGVFSDYQPLSDTKMTPVKNEFGVTLADVDKQPTNYKLDPSRDIAANIMNEPFIKREPAMSAQAAAEKITEAVTKPKVSNPRPSAALVEEFMNFAKDIRIVGDMSKETARAFIIDKQRDEGLTAEQFRRKYVDMAKKRAYEKALKSK